MRAIVPAALAGALILTGCSAGGAPSKDAAGEACLVGGSASEAIKVKGETGTDLELTSKSPVTAKKTELTVLKEGEGDVVKEGESISVAMTMINGSNGEVMQQVPASSIPFSKSQLSGWAYDGLRCAVSGSQSALVAPYAEVFGETDASTMQVEGLTNESSIVVVMAFGEIADAVEGQDPTASGQPGQLSEDELLKKAEGKAQKPVAGLPTVELDKDGKPTITIPKDSEAPTKLQVETLIAGDGEEVKAGDRVYVHYRGVIWRTGEEFDSSWKRGAPTDFTTDGVIKGFSEALVGKKVGSQVISVVPAEDGGYGGAQLESMGYEKDDVMVFVLDILGTVHAE